MNHFESIRGKEWENILWCDDDLIGTKTVIRMATNKRLR